ncbi:MAG: Flp pilus assembly protein CpaB [Candidatus Latescibacterota bacterium]|nr:MAG: Flp pilus assembly protein CpaB [Candidatus Latescibacterota bacterium]
MDKKGVAFLLIATVLAVAAAGTVYLYLKGMPAAQAEATPTVPVVVATKDMTFGTTLKDEHLKLVEFPKESVPPNSYGAIDSVLSQTTKVFVADGEPILASKLSAIGGGLSVRVAPNMRAMSLDVNDVTGVSGFVLPGDRVDVLVTVDNAAGSNVAVTKTILQDLEVLAAGVKTETKGNKHITVQTVTVLVDPEGAEKLALGVHQGQVHLALRNPVDHEIVAAKSTNTKSVLGIASSKKASRRRTAPKKTVTTKKEPVEVDPTFTVIRDGRILKQESPTGKGEEESKDDKDSGKK